MSLTPEQLIERRKGIGGSDAAAVVGISSYRTPLDVYLDKLGYSEPIPGNIYMDVGNHMEPFIRDLYAKQINRELIQPSEPCIHQDYPWMRCNLDFVSEDHSLAGEIKFTSYFSAKWGETLTDNMPSEYLIQCAHNCLVAESHYNISYDTFPLVAFGFGKGLGLREYIYKRDSNLEKKLIAAEKNFWNENVLKEIPPEAINRSDANETYNEVVDGAIVADDKILVLYNSINDVKMEMNFLKDKEDHIKMEIYKALQNNQFVINQEGKKIISWAPSSYSKFDIAKFKNEQPDLYNSYLNKTTTRVLRIS